MLSGRAAGPHKIQGIGAGFLPSVLNRDVIDEVLPIDDELAIDMARRAAAEEGRAPSASRPVRRSPEH